jgi:hypothetical protein
MQAPHGVVGREDHEESEGEVSDDGYDRETCDVCGRVLHVDWLLHGMCRNCRDGWLDDEMRDLAREEDE